LKPANSTLSRYGATIFDTMSRLAREKGALNLGQGTPEGMEPADVIAVAAEALRKFPNQYPPMYGLPELRQAVAAHDLEYYGLELDWQRETLVTSGGTEALASSLLALIDPGDEVVVLEPSFDSYLPIIRLAGGVPKLVRLEPPEWKLPEDKLTAAFGSKTKLILFNTPMNPTAKVFTVGEMEFIAAQAIKHDAYVIADEVYEHMVYDGAEHIPILALPGLRERAVRIGSAGKTFSMTGWKVGYISACARLIEKIVRAHQYLVFATPPNLQRAVAYGLTKPRDSFTNFTATMQGKRDRFIGGLERAGFGVAPCQGTYFVNVDIGSVGFEGDDVAFCTDIIEKAGVAAIPVSVFYDSAPESRFVRFCFAKPDAVLDDAAARLAERFK
jgi:aspartate/methionine/tyrosine aminotransferase